MSEKLFPSIPAIGSDKQDGFARILAHKLALSLPAFEADIKAATKRDTLAVFPHYYSKEEAGRIIDYLLAKCKLAGIEIASRKGNGRRGSGRRGEQGGGDTGGKGSKSLAEYGNADLLRELEERGCSGVLAHASVTDCCARLERLGYPGDAIKGNPDLVGQAGNLGRLLLAAFKGKAEPNWEAETRFALVNAGLLT